MRARAARLLVVHRVTRSSVRAVSVPAGDLAEYERKFEKSTLFVSRGASRFIEARADCPDRGGRIVEVYRDGVLTHVFECCATQRAL